MGESYLLAPVYQPAIVTALMERTNTVADKNYLILYTEQKQSYIKETILAANDLTGLSKIPVFFR